MGLMQKHKSALILSWRQTINIVFPREPMPLML
uniref:Uncharacterized protein n=1 Tax=Anguilla anguilla TaxID=7936 RepID=A0A0E9TKG0_ANGAN